MAFLNDFRQSHFIVYELVLPYCTVCTPVYSETESWHTPVTCEESSDATYSLWFTSNNSPLIAPPAQSIGVKSRLNSSVFRCVSSASESTAKLKPGEGMASRGSMSLTCTDFNGDPGPINFTDKGTFFGKLEARNILESKKIISHYYTLASDSSVPVEVSTSTHFVESNTLANGVFSLKAKDALKDLEAFSQQFPKPSEAVLTSSINSTQTSFTVDNGAKVDHNGALVIDDEIMEIVSIVGNTVNVTTRGSTVTNIDGETVYKTINTAHDTDATVQGAWLCKKTFVTDLIYDIFEVAGLLDYANATQWLNEVSVWNASANVVGIFYEPDKVIDVLNGLMETYTLDMWLDQPTQKAVISAVSVWKEAGKSYSEESDFTGLKVSNNINDRYSRAYINSRKDYKTRSDDKVNYSKLTLATNAESETSDFYGNVRIKEFDPNPYITNSGSQALVTRYVQRFSKTPKLFSFKMEERKLNGLELSDIINIKSRGTQSASGASLANIDRAQVIEIRPDLNDIGRTYMVSAYTYVPLISDGESGGQLLTLFENSTLSAIDLFSYAGSPSVPVDWTFVFDNCIVGSDANEITKPAITAGPWPIGSTIKLIFTGNSKISAKGGDSGDAVVNVLGPAIASNSKNGEVIYNSSGVNTSIYLNYSDIDGYSPSSTMYAPGGGGASSAIASSKFTSVEFKLYDAHTAVSVTGGGGSGIPSGISGNPSASGADVGAYDLSVKSGGDGSFSSGGASVSTSAFASDGPAESLSSATGGSGGFASDGFAASASSNGDSFYEKISIGSAGLAGAAIKGSGVTVYCLAASALKFKPGNSDAFTLIDA